MTKRLKNVLITVFSFFMCLLFGMTLFMPSANTVKAESQDFVMPDTSSGYFARCLMDGEDLSNKIIRFYNRIDESTGEPVMPDNFNFGGICTFYPESNFCMDVAGAGTYYLNPYFNINEKYIDFYIDKDIILDCVAEQQAEQGLPFIEDFDWSYFYVEYSSNKLSSTLPVGGCELYVLEEIPDTSEFIEEKKLVGGENINGRWIRVYQNVEVVYIGDKLEVFPESVDYSDGGFCLSSVLECNGTGYVDYYINMDWINSELPFTPREDAVLSVEDMVVGVIYLIDEEGKGAYLLSSPVEELPEELPDGQPDTSEEDKGIIDKITDFVNVNTGWAITSSTMTVVLIGLVIYVLFRKK